jgi:hypothetical protein
MNRRCTYGCNISRRLWGSAVGNPRILYLLCAGGAWEVRFGTRSQGQTLFNEAESENLPMMQLDATVPVTMRYLSGISPRLCARGTDFVLLCCVFVCWKNAYRHANRRGRCLLIMRCCRSLLQVAPLHPRCHNFATAVCCFVLRAGCMAMNITADFAPPTRHARARWPPGNGNTKLHGQGQGRVERVESSEKRAQTHKQCKSVHNAYAVYTAST